ncbi:MAG: ABC transporter permease, partial [Bacteroidota bacterium]
RSKWFIATTLLAPLFSLALIIVPLLAFSGDDGTERVAIRDETGQLLAPIAEAVAPRIDVEPVTDPLDTLRAQVLNGQLDGALILPASILGDTTAVGADGPPAGAIYYTRGSGLDGDFDLRNAVRTTVRRARAELAGADSLTIAQFESSVGFDRVTVSADGDGGDNALGRFLLANVLSLLVYIAILIYGAMVMRGVIEEKANRIVEVVASSVTPFELMMGKVLGIGAVGLTQLIGWSLLMFLFSALASPIMLALAPDTASSAAPNGAPFDVTATASILSPGLLVAFVLFFLGGYLLFSGLFAAVGSAVDQESDAQSMQAPIMIPLVLPVLFLTAVADNPDGPLAVFLSLFPVSSPVTMIVRMAVSDVPWWQVALSLALLVAAFVGVIALAARIYRVGILMYGKKATFKDLWRWMRTA